MDSHSLLPSNQSPTEKLLSQTLYSATSLDGDRLIRSLYNAQTCPADLLSYLAQAVAVDFWDHRWSEQQKRGVIENALEIHRLKGTPAALLIALENRGIDATVREWWQQRDPQWWLPPTQAQPGTIVVHSLLNDNAGIDKSKLQQIDSAITHAKRHSIHFELELGLKWDEKLALSLFSAPQCHACDRAAEMLPLHPEPAVAALATSGACQIMVLADFDFEGEIS
ncbi:MAG: phage tail protein I [Psychrosphaera sp.]|nr:phage tail protein I [Psychrosphaera sp.]